MVIDVSFPGRLVANVAAREIVKFLYGKTVQDVADWFSASKDLSELLPNDFGIPSGVAGRISKQVLRNPPERVGDSCPLYDLVLQNVYDVAGYAMQELDQMGDKEGAAKMRNVQIIAAFLGNQKVRPWYYENMDRLYTKIAARLKGDTDGPKEG